METRICLISKCRSLWFHWRHVVASHSVLCLGPSLPQSKLEVPYARPLCWNLDSMRGNVWRQGWLQGSWDKAIFCLTSVEGSQVRHPLSLHGTLSFSLIRTTGLLVALQHCRLQVSSFSPCVLETLCILHFFFSAYCKFPMHIKLFQDITWWGNSWQSSG